MIIQLLVVDFVVASNQHDTVQIGKSIADDFPIPGRSLGVTRHYVGGDSQLLRAGIGGKELLHHTAMVMNKFGNAQSHTCPGNPRT